MIDFGGSLQPYYNVAGLNLNALQAFFSGLSQSDRIKTALAWDAAGRSIVTGGGSLATDTVLAPIGASVYLGNRAALDRALEGYVRSFTYWPTRKTDAELIALAG